VALALVSVALTPISQASPTQGPVATTSRKATLSTFTGLWIGHTRFLRITRKARAKESIGNGCCDQIVDLKLRVSRPRGTARRASIRARVVGVRWHDRSAFDPNRTPPHVGQVKQLRLRHGVITDPLTGATYCNRAAGRRGTCGA
jgi:hypothetical protein